MGASQFERRRRYAPRVRGIEDLTDEEIALIAQARASSEHDHLNSLLDE